MPTRPTWSLWESFKDIFRTSPRRAFERYSGFIAFVIFLGLLLAFLPSQSTSTAGQGQASAAASGATNVGASGLTRGGFSCGPGKRQIPWMTYSPLCEPVFKGNNGGSTANGVTKDTITLTYREANASTINILYNFVPKAVIGTNQQAESTIAAYVGLFNHLYELYGRHVVFKPYKGKGDFLQEDLGLNTQGAQADALDVASDIHGFADASFVSSSQPYVETLARNKVVAFTFYENTPAFYAANAPYVYSGGPDCYKQAEAAAAVAQRSVVGMPATYVGASLQGLPGKVALLHQDIASALACDDLAKKVLAKAGITPTLDLSYTFNLANFNNEATADIAQLAADKVTYVIWLQADPVSPSYFLTAATKAGYFPTWFMGTLFSYNFTGYDAFGSLFSPQQMVHTIGPGFPTPTEEQKNEALRALRMTGIAPQDISPIYPWIYATLVQFFDALQAAGPDLNPYTFQAGMFNSRGVLPTHTGVGQFGSWRFANGAYDPVADYEVLTYNPGLVSPLDNVAEGVRGAFVPCYGGKVFDYDSSPRKLQEKVPLSCP
jgi:hypothetical protein